MTDIADDRNVDPHVFVDRARVDIDVNLLGVRRKRIQAPGDPVIKPEPTAIITSQSCMDMLAS